MDLIGDFLLLAASLGAALYCYILAKRLRRFTALETGMGGAIAVLSAQVDEMTQALQKAQRIAGQSEERLEALTLQAEQVVQRLEFLLASLHELPSEDVIASPPDVLRDGQRRLRRRLLRPFEEAG